MMSAVQQALAKLRKARSVDEGDDYADELAKAARKNVDEVIDLFYNTRENTFMLVWCLQGLTNERVIGVFRHALKHNNQYVRWAGVEGLKHCSDPKLIPVFIRALRDRSHVVKGVAVDWLTSHGDSTAIEPLERLLGLPSMIKNSPGTVARAKKAIVLCGQRTPE